MGCTVVALFELELYENERLVQDPKRDAVLHSESYALVSQFIAFGQVRWSRTRTRTPKYAVQPTLNKYKKIIFKSRMLFDDHLFS